MLTAYVAVTIAIIVANAGAAAADFSRARFVLANAAELGVAETWLPLLGALKAAGAAGLLIGLLGVQPLGIAAAIGLVLFFIGALATTSALGSSTTSPSPGCSLHWRSRLWSLAPLANHRPSSGDQQAT
jgi:hypothetical protein